MPHAGGGHELYMDRETKKIFPFFLRVVEINK